MEFFIGKEMVLRSKFKRRHLLTNENISNEADYLDDAQHLL